MRIIFYILAAWTIGAGLLVMTQRDIIRCALALVAFFAGIAGIFFTLRADFLGAVQLLIYVGAIAVLILFAIMVTRREGAVSATETRFSRGAAWGWIAAAALTLLIALAVLALPQPLIPPGPPLAVADLGAALTTHFAVPFMMIALLLTAALVASAMLAVEEPPPGPPEVASNIPHARPPAKTPL